MDGYFTVGDYGYLDQNGWLYIADRRTDLIISGGVNIYPAEIEAKLLEHPFVGDAVVVGMPSEEWGEEVVALIEPLDDITAGSELAKALLRWCRTGLAAYKCPRRIDFRKLPRTATGKLSRRRVKEAYLAELLNTSKSHAVHTGMHG